MKINGKTEIYGILGDPIKQVATPELMNSIYKKDGENKVLIPFHVNQVSLGLTIQGLKKIQNFKGAVITMPHKVEVLKYIDEAINRRRKIDSIYRQELEGIDKARVVVALFRSRRLASRPS